LDTHCRARAAIGARICHPERNSALAPISATLVAPDDAPFPRMHEWVACPVSAGGREP
jgi:hypothetical protein